MGRIQVEQNHRGKKILNVNNKNFGKPFLTIVEMLFLTHITIC